MPLDQDTDRSGYSLVDRIREYFQEGMNRLTHGDTFTSQTWSYTNILDAHTLGDEELPKTGAYLTILLGDVAIVSRPNIVKRIENNVPQTISCSWQEVTAYIDFVRFRDPVCQAQVFQAWINLQEARNAAYIVGITPIKVMAIRDITFVTSGAHERRAQLELRFGMVIETPMRTLDSIDSMDIQGWYEDHELEIDV